ncbi:ExbD/TolR family protein [Roseibacillus ishigakijimensis]|uniref:Biopolymer transporter ExbD n=1 Tax=Roseibacillus ishigakijimensis TaxID=454146 RepID=A0A934RR58_9BACT|nr:biopolymer transporter ExbD [Roseibacillus ishigakijimensis]MBK1834116.1 biopolymer transporter ExbD [Roseibacillus ishigakijimensis]
MELYRPKRKAYNVPIVPLIDILAILLIFVIVTSTRKKPRPVVPIELPTVKEVASSELTVERSVLALTREGDILLEGVTVPEGELAGYLKAFQTVNPDRELELEADEGSSLGQLFKVWEALSEVGIELKEVPARINLPTENN